jgi:hypothetical protein
MKQIKFKPRMTVEHKQRIIAVAYITQREGGLQSSNVTGDLIRILGQDGYNVAAGKGSDQRINVTNVMAEAMRWLAGNGYAARVVKGRHTVEFVMDPDVDVPVPDYVKGKQLKQGKSEPVVTAPNKPAPPLPSALRGPSLGRLEAALRKWWLASPDTAQEWIDSVCEDLEAT